MIQKTSLTCLTAGYVEKVMPSTGPCLDTLGINITMHLNSNELCEMVRGTAFTVRGTSRPCEERVVKPFWLLCNGMCEELVRGTVNCAKNGFAVRGTSRTFVFSVIVWILQLLFCFVIVTCFMFPFSSLSGFLQLLISVYFNVCNL